MSHVTELCGLYFLPFLLSFSFFEFNGILRIRFFNTKCAIGKGEIVQICYKMTHRCRDAADFIDNNTKDKFSKPNFFSTVGLNEFSMLSHHTM